MSRPKLKRINLLDLEDEPNSGDFSSGSEDVYIPDNVDANGSDVTERESSMSLNSSISRSSICASLSHVQTQKSSHKSKFDTYFNIELKGTNRDKIARCKSCINSKEIKMAWGNTTGLKKHLRSKHLKKYFELFPEEEAEQISKKQQAGASTSSLSIPEMFALKSQLKVTDDPSEYLDVDEQPSLSDSHEAMNNRGYKPEQRRKRSFEFLMGLINNNSKYEVIRSDPDLSRNRLTPKNLQNQTKNIDATKLLLDLLTKIVTYPERWRQIHQILRNLDQDLTSSQHILRHHQQTSETYSSNLDKETEKKRAIQHNKWQEQTTDSTTIKWPNFDDIEENIVASSTIRTTHKKEEKNNDKSAYQKNFSYHKVTGKPPHFKKNPTAYIAVSAISPKPSELEEEFLLETELHQLKPWKNKRSSRRV